MINLSRVAYPEVKHRKVIGALHDYTINKGKIVTKNHGTLTENINTCVGGVLNAGNRNFMFHVAPEMQPLNPIKRELAKQVEILRETCGSVKGLICGGLELNSKDNESVQSFNLYNTIADVLDELGVQFTMLCGKEKGAPLENIYAINENTTLWGDAFKNLFNKNTDSKEEIIDVLENHYQFVEIPDAEIVKVTDTFASARTQGLIR